MPRQRVRWANPQRFKLLFVIGHRVLAIGHARHQKRHIKAARQVAVGHPVRQQIHLRRRRREPVRGQLRVKGRSAVHRVNGGLAGPRALRVTRQQNPQLLKALTNRGQRLHFGCYAL